MVVVKMLKRRDAASVVVAVVVAMILYALVSALSDPVSSSLSDRNPSPVSDWHSQYLYPIVLAVVELVVLEVLGWVYVWVNSAFRQK